ncbi:MAG: hypothetical protein EYC62_02325 [Alphaproteobacteria bacterium]|nr:MAG: hypothetical protein EYC62_02325 [Alphaproteobacteria bacterium]
MKRRNFLTAFGIGLPVFAFAKRSEASTLAKAQDAGLKIPQGAWNILAKATEGTDPSTAITALPKISGDIRKLKGQDVTLEGYLQSIPSPGKKLYLLSRAPFHCAFCYAGGRASLALIESEKHLPATDQLVALTGKFDFQDSDPEDYYFTLHDARIA